MPGSRTPPDQATSSIGHVGPQGHLPEPRRLRDAQGSRHTPERLGLHNDGDSGTYRTWLGYGESVDLVGKGTLGNPDLGPLSLRWVPFRTGGTAGNGGIDTDATAVSNPVTISVELDELIGGTWTPVTGASNSVTLTSGAAGPFAERVIAVDRTYIGDFSKLSLKFTVSTLKSTAQMRRRTEAERLPGRS